MAGASLADWTPRLAEATAALPKESLDDMEGPPLAEGNRGGGGLDVLDTQARNPLWAFVRHRLGGRELAPYADSATVNVRGQFLHKALELVWGMMPEPDETPDVIATQRLAAWLEQLGRASWRERRGQYV